jgi:hippurate hydrolase
MGMVVEEFTRRFGKERVVEAEPVMGGEDFSEFGRVEPRIPNVYFNIGGVDPDKYAQAKASGTALPSNHSALFAPLPEPTLRTGVESMAVAALYLLRTAPKVKPAVF